MMHPAENQSGYNDTLEFYLDSLPVGSRFRLANPDGRHVIGTLVEIERGGCVVRLDRPNKSVTIKQGDGSTTTFDSSRARTTRWQSRTPVEFLEHIVLYPEDPSEDSDAQIQNENGDDTMKAVAKKKSAAPAKKSTTTAAVAKKSAPAKKSPSPSPVHAPVPVAAASSPVPATVVVAATPQAKALVARWKLGTAQLHKLASVDTSAIDLVAINTARERLVSVYTEAVAAQVLLPPPGYKDPIFADMELAAVDVAVVMPGAATKTNGVDKKAASKANGAAKKASAPRAARPKKTKELHDCLCGCGEGVTGNFKQGHDARYRGQILRVERGELKKSELPELMQSSLKFRPLGEGHFECTNSVLSH